MPELAAGRQLTLNFEAGLTDRHDRLIDCIRECIIANSRPLKAIAADMDLSQSELSRRLSPSDKDRRNFSVDDMEAYISTQQDVTPIYFLIEKYLESTEHKKARAIDILSKLMPALQAALSTVQDDSSLRAVK